MMEQTTYEDMVRTMMGKNAYLMFVFDRLVFATLKNIPAFQQLDEFQ